MGSKLMKKVLKKMKSNLNEAFCQIYSKNKSSIKMAEKSGAKFVKTDLFKKYAIYNINLKDYAL